MAPDPDEIIGRMVDDEESDWPDRLLRQMAKLPIVEEKHIRGYGITKGTVTKREKEVLVALSHGMGLDGAADLLGIGLESAKTHLASARAKLRAKNKTHAVALALRQGLIN